MIRKKGLALGIGVFVACAAAGVLIVDTVSTARDKEQARNREAALRKWHSHQDHIEGQRAKKQQKDEQRLAAERDAIEKRHAKDGSKE